jgi:pyridoxine kinase
MSVVQRKVKALKVGTIGKMARILAISSQVARGAVGLSVMVPALQRLGHEVIALPSIVLSNHPGHAHSAGLSMPVARLDAMLMALEANGWLYGLDAVVSGYLPTARHVRLIADWVGRLRALARTPALPYLCDPVLGDEPKGLYIDPAAAEAIRKDLVPLADILTPNRFELGYLATGCLPDHLADLAEARAAVAAFKAPIVVATSIPGEGGSLVNVMAAAGALHETRVARRPHAPHGSGDLFATLLAAALAGGKPPPEALGLATAGVDRVLAASAGSDALDLRTLPDERVPLTPWPVEAVGKAAAAAPIC